MKHNRNLIFIGLFFLYYQAGFGQEPELATDTFDLNKVWQYTEKNHKKVEILRLQTIEKQEDIKNTQNSKLPYVQVEGSYGKRSDLSLYEAGILHQPTEVPIQSTQYNTSLSADLLLYKGFQTKRAIQIQKVELTSLNTLVQQSIAEAKIESTQLFYGLILNIQYRELVEKEITQDEKQLKDIMSLYQNGTILKSDVLRSEVTRSNHQMLLKEIENRLTLITQQLNIIMGRKDTDSLIPLYSDLDLIPGVANYEENLDQALEDAYGLQLADQKILREELALKQITSALLPKVSLFADYGFNFPQNKSYPYASTLYSVGQIGLKVNLSLSSFYHTHHQKKSQQIQIIQQQVEKEHKKDQIKQELQAYYVQYQESLDRIALAEKNILQTTETLRIIRHSYFNQQALLLDLLDAETQVLQAQFDLTSAQINAKIEYYQIQKVIGNL